MATTTGTATSMTDLRSRIVAACQSGGWSWDAANEVVYRDGVFVRLTAQSATIMALHGRTAIDGGAAETSVAYMAKGGAGDWVWPVTYEVFCFASEVYVIVNTHEDFYQWLAWGKSLFADALPGSGAWYAGSTYQTGVSWTPVITIDRSGSSYSSSYTGSANTNPGLFWSANFGFVHHGLTAATPWASGSPGGCPLINDLLAVLPNSWNDEVVLLPIRKAGPTVDSRYALTLELRNARYTRNDWYAPGEVVTIGQDRWKIYPFFKKNVQYRNGTVSGGTSPSGGSNHSGTLAMAIRYDGP